MSLLIKILIELLDAFAEAKRIEYARKFYPTKMHVIGVAVPKVKLVLKELKKQTKVFAPREKIDLVKLLINEDVFELQQLAFEYLISEEEILAGLTDEDFRALEKNLDNWLSVDYFSTIIGYAWRENLISTQKVKSYLHAENHWMRRMVVVATVSLNQKARGGTGDSERTLEVCQLVVDDRDEMVVRALSWALRELGKVAREPVIGFIKKNETRLHKRVLREVKNKLETGKKN